MSRLQILRGMRFWNLSGGLAAVYLAVTAGAYSTGYALELGASDALIGFLSAAPAMAQALQLVSPLFIERLRRRKPLCIGAYLLAYLMWVPAAFIPLVFPEPWRPWALVGFVTVSGLMIAMASPASTSWLTDLVPPDLRARWLSRNQSILAFIGLLASLIAGRYMDLFPEGEKQPGFIALFLVAALFGTLSIGAWTGVPEPPKPTSERRGMLGFLTLPLRNDSFRNFTMFVAVRGMAVMIAAPFFTVFMLRWLKIPYSQIAVFSILVTVSQMASNPLWSYLADKFGYRPVLRLSSFGTALIPLIWFFVTPENYWYIIPPAQAWAGAMSAGLVLSQFNLMLKIAPEENRSVYIGFYSAVANIALSIGALFGGVVASWLESFGEGAFHYPYVADGRAISHLQVVFLVSSMARMIGLSFFHRIREDEAVPARVMLKQVGSGKPLSAWWNLRRLLVSSDAETRVKATRALGQAGSALVVEELVEALDDSDREVRREAARALGAIGEPRAAAPLIEHAQDPRSDVVEVAIEALGKLPADESVETLIGMLDDPRPSVREAAATALGNAGSKEAEAPLEAMLNNETDAAVVMAATDALSRIGGRRAIHRLRALLRNATGESVRKQFAHSISRLLGDSPRFYRLVEAEPLRQDEQLGRLLAGTRRRLGARWADAEARAFFQERLTEAMGAMEAGEYLPAVQVLSRVAGRAMHAFAASERGLGVLAAQPGVAPPDLLPLDERVTQLLALRPSMRLNYGFLTGLVNEARRRRQAERIEALLAVFSFHRLVDELERLAQGR